VIEIFKEDAKRGGGYLARDTESNWWSRRVSLDILALEIYEKSKEKIYPDTPMTGMEIVFPRTPKINVLGNSSHLFLPVPENEVVMFYRELSRYLYLNDPDHSELEMRF